MYLDVIVGVWSCRWLSLLVLNFFFFKQKTAYEMRISDWSSDVCSSDLFGEDQTLMRVGYARVSTSDQNPELQLDALRRAGCERVFTEKASGARDDRPELARILEDVLRAGDTLVVWKLDRLARSLKKLIATAEDLEREKIGLVSLTESIDTTTPGGMLTFHVFGAIAQFERSLIRQRTPAGLVEARRQRCKGCRPPATRPPAARP